MTILESLRSSDKWAVGIDGAVTGVSKGGGSTSLFQKKTRRLAGCVQTLKIFGAAGQSVASPFSFTTAWMVEGDYSAVRFLYGNYGSGTFALTAAKTAACPSMTNDGSALTTSNVTFNNSATAKAGDTWNGAAGGTTSYTMPARISGSGANTVPSLVWSDWVPQTSVPCTDVGSQDLRIVYQRAYSASSGFTVCNGGTSATNYGNYNQFSRRKVWGQVNAGDQVSTMTAVSMAANHQWMLCLGVQALLIKPIYNHGVFGDSISKGQGSFDNNNGAWGWAQRSPQQLTDQGIGRHSVVNYAASGQSKSPTWDTFLNVISQGGLDTAILFPWSPNDGIAAGSAPWALSNFKFQVFAFLAECKKNGTKPIIATQPPSITITDSASDLIRVAQNNEIRQLVAEGVVIADFDAAVTDGNSPARYQPGLSGDNQHPNSAGHEVMATVYSEAIQEALSL